MVWNWWTLLAGLHGHIDFVDAFHVRGWAADRWGMAPELAIQVDGRTVDRIVPTYIRDDLQTWFRHSPRLGFYYVFDDPVPAGAMISITDIHGRALSNSPQVVPPPHEQSLPEVVDGLTTPVPEPHLIYLVAGHRDRFKFAMTRRPPVDYIIERLKAAGADHATFDAILDFGCGCGRILAGWEGRLSVHTKLLGCDINPRLVAFCAANIPFATSFVSNYLPPLETIAAGEIDFLYAASVFTHLNESAARDWVDEIRRVLKPGGLVMMSFHGNSFRDVLASISKKGIREFDRHGFYCHIHGLPNRSRPGSNEYATFMTPDFTIGLFDGFEVVEMIPSVNHGNPFSAAQDVAIFRRV